MPDIDDVSLRIEATAQQAIAAIKKLRGGLYDVKTGTDAATNSTNASAKAVNSAANSVSKLASAYRKMGLTSLSKEMGSVAQAANRIKGVTKSIKDATKAAEFFDKNGKSGIAEAIRGLGTDPVGAERALREETRIAKENAAERKAFAIQEAKERTAELQRMAKIARESEKAYTQITQEEAKKRADAESARQALTKKIGEESLKYAQEAEEAKRRGERYDAAQAAKRAAEAEKESAKAAKEHASQLTKAKAALNKFGKSFGQPLRKVKELVSSFKRIAMYRAIRAAIKAISSAVKEGLTNLYGYSQQVKTAFAPAVDELRKRVLLLKNAFATALRPIIEALIPVAQRLIEWLAKMADFVAQVFSVLTGKVDSNNRYTKAVLSDLQDSNKQAKELRRTLLGFDEINRLDGDAGKDNGTNYGLMFTQADVSPEAAAVAEKIADAWGKIKEFLSGVDWEGVVKFVTAFLAFKTVLNVIRKVFNVVKSLATLLGGAGMLGAIVALVAIFALWGGKISKWLDNTKTKINDFLNKLKNSRVAWNAVVQLIQDIISLVSDTVSKIASFVYNLFHGNFSDAFNDLIDLLATLVKGVINIVGGALNIILGFVSDMINDIVAAGVWLWNNGLSPIINVAATVLHNAFINLKLSFWYLAEALLTAANWALSKISAAINVAIAAWNLIMDDDVEPINLQLDTSSVTKKIKELESMKLDPLKETIEVTAKVTQPKKFDLTLDLTAANRAVDNIASKIKGIVENVGRIASGLANSNASRYMSNYASGGYPAMGSVFIAGEQGAEWVGDINGRTGVMNTDQMANAVYNAVVAAMASAPQSGGGDIYLDGEVIYRNVVNRNNNQVRSTGRAALLT